MIPLKLVQEALGPSAWWSVVEDARGSRWSVGIRDGSGQRKILGSDESFAVAIEQAKLKLGTTPPRGAATP